ncbi:hypothetical protein AB684_16755 [Bacillus licheniformis]|uniref:Uncharacterized protein n=1 Tax=Bacillus licheniformis TaxID=1402 RepID=A0A8B5YFC1_BACLI|nr:hypothetical protein AB684_16755 [Bacillus licheniformis]AOP16485.1 hypothetical protein BL1202_03563 [Bacillus licheniformis]ARC74910.1 hypothetical protein B37_02884 [Bacillus licheniformis]ARW44059.1 hypothetical protein S100141_02763 [Bacillus licheniformis]ARW55419.1 hypothetical protein S100027_03449 [Bacillus licheniformis]
MRFKNALDIQVTKLLLPYMGMSPKNLKMKQSIILINLILKTSVSITEKKVCQQFANNSLF